MKIQRLIHKKKFFFENERSITWEELLKKSLDYSNEINRVNDKYVPIIIGRNIDFVISILGSIFANKAFVQYLENFQIKK